MRTDHAAWAAPGEAELRVTLPLGGEAEAEGEGEGEGEGSVQVRALSWAAPAGRKVDEERLRSGSSDQLVELIFGGHHPHVRKGAARPRR